MPAVTWDQRAEDIAAAETEVSAKFLSPEKPPEGLHRELLTILAEECCEVGQRVSKSLRFGVTEVQPGQSLSNQDRLSDEVGDLLAMIDTLIDRGLLSPDRISEAKLSKRAKLYRYLQSVDDENGTQTDGR